MIIDIHTHVGSKKFISSTVTDLQNEMKKSKVNVSICFPLGKDVENKSIELANQRNENIIPFFRYDPKTISLEKLKQSIRLFKGIKLHPRLEDFDPLSAEYNAMFRTIENAKKPVLIHTRKENNENTDPDRLIELVRRYPKINFIFAHFANGVDSVFSKIAELENLYFDTSIVSSPKIIELTVRKYGSERILFGSDFPYSDQELELQKILRADIGKKEKENILFRNAKLLLKS